MCLAAVCLDSVSGSGLSGCCLSGCRLCGFDLSGCWLSGWRVVVVSVCSLTVHWLSGSWLSGFKFLIKTQYQIALGSPGAGSLQFPSNFFLKILKNCSRESWGRILAISFQFLIKNIKKLLSGALAPAPCNFPPISYSK